MQFISDFDLPNAAGNRLLSLIRLGQSYSTTAVPKDHRRMVERTSKSYGRSIRSITHSISIKNIHPCLKDMQDIVFEYVASINLLTYILLHVCVDFVLNLY